MPQLLIVFFPSLIISVVVLFGLALNVWSTKTGLIHVTASTLEN